MREKNQFELGSAACARETFGAMEINLVGEGRQSGKTRKGERREPSPTLGEPGPGLGCAGSFRRIPVIINHCFVRTQMQKCHVRCCTKGKILGASVSQSHLPQVKGSGYDPSCLSLLGTLFQTLLGFCFWFFFLSPAEGEDPAASRASPGAELGSLWITGSLDSARASGSALMSGGMDPSLISTCQKHHPWIRRCYNWGGIITPNPTSVPALEHPGGR